MNGLIVRPRVSDLAFRTYDRVLHPELFASAATRRIAKPGYTLEVKIVPSGHVLEWCCKRGELTEWITSLDERLPEVGRRIAFPFQPERSGRCELPCGIEYQVCTQVEILPPEVFVHVHQELVEDGAKRGLLFHFQPHRRLGLSPLGFVAIEPLPRGLAVSSFHTFPDELTIVKTQSLIENF